LEAVVYRWPEEIHPIVFCLIHLRLRGFEDIRGLRYTLPANHLQGKVSAFFSSILNSSISFSIQSPGHLDPAKESHFHMAVSSALSMDMPRRS